ncbi:uncharacterized protein LOC116126896 [Pistacia vera]|uniref:uncharacterized protein LOC116126896 n=1 Tax=Pistacia vera TaxID=55513 RepID=UPI001262FE1C|nr:uncharacterized protein LOC116126896 [Pistacia vera]
MEGIEHRIVKVNGINMHVAEKGKGPIILFLHGFPELWFSWRHQILALSSLGYRCVAPDLRGFGDTEAPPSQTSYTCLHVIGDLVMLIDGIAGKDEKVFVVGHDWGAYMAWYLCLFRPDKIAALFNTSVVFKPFAGNIRPLDGCRAFFGDDYYICRFQEPGGIEGEIAEHIGVERFIKGFLTYRIPGPIYLPKGKGFGHLPDTPIVLPPWLSEEDVKYYTTKFEKTGFTGGVNYYRNLDLNWELVQWSGGKVNVPVKFVVGQEDLCYHLPGVKEYIHNGGFKKDVPLLDEVVVMEGAAHFIQQEKPREITKHIYDYFQKF